MDLNQLFSAVLLGIVEGLTEFLPVSSTGHLILFSELISFSISGEATFEIAIQAGAILAVVILYWQRFLLLFNFQNSADNFGGFNGILKLAVACFPSFLMGFLLHGFIKKFLFSSTTVAIALILGGILFIIIPRLKLKETTLTLDNLSYQQVFFIGLWQVLSLCPGVSRSGVTIIGGLFCGLSKNTSAQFSFILAVPTLLAAVSYDLYKNYHLIKADDISLFLLGTFISFISGLIAIRTFIGLLQNYSIAWWGWYRILVGLVVFCTF